METKSTKAERAKRNADIFQMRYSEGMTPEEIAVKVGLTRQRIEQILNKHITSFPVQDRMAVSMGILSRYLEVDLTPHCLRCWSREISRGDICEACRQRLDILRLIKGELRSFRKTGSQQSRRSAVWLIRKHHVEPEDLI